MAEIDDTLRQALSRIAPDADPTGVADAIRARVAAGDTGTPAPSSGFRTGVRGWLPFVGLIVVAAILGGGIGLSGLLGHPIGAPLLASSSQAVAEGTGLFNCPGGVVVGYARRGERILAIERTSDDRYVGIRNPGSPADTVWLPIGEMKSDAGQPAIASLAVGGCPTVTVETTQAPVAPVVPVIPAVPPAPTRSTPPKPKDTTPPVLNVGKPSADPIWGIGSSCSPTSTTIATTASDAGGVVSATAVSSFAGTVISPSGPPTATVFTISANEPGVVALKTVTITVTAIDSSGNKTTRTASFGLYSSGNCVG